MKHLNVILTDKEYEELLRCIEYLESELKYYEVIGAERYSKLLDKIISNVEA